LHALFILFGLSVFAETDAGFYPTLSKVNCHISVLICYVTLFLLSFSFPMLPGVRKNCWPLLELGCFGRPNIKKICKEKLPRHTNLKVFAV